MGENCEHLLIRWSLLVFGCLLVIRHGAEAVVGGTCAASGYECSALSGGYCKTGTGCACSAIYDVSGTSCTAKRVGVTCTSSGGECQYILAGYCDTTTNANAPVCACAAIADIASQTCNFKGGSEAITASFVMVMACLVIGFLQI
ncbi:hypothetical protein MAR_008758 [Mya arenaria]|uniref:Uncharacterized protein n=1 Tax=Mya arenaria TaxID=6604 RepID=A0ABY7DZT5_MYAAR|nr:hypothetical protein MAR_008758 [Mya arenaria]